MIASVLDALDSFRVVAVNRPLLLTVAIAVGLSLLARVAPARFGVDALDRILPPVIRATTLVALAGLIGAVAFYVADPHYFDNAEPTMPAVGWLFHVGQPVYHAIDAAQRYAHIYGPMAFVVQGVALGWLGPSVLVSKIVGASACLLALYLLAIARPNLPGQTRWLVAGIAAIAFLMFRDYAFWTRAEPLQLLCVAAALVGVFRFRGLGAAVIVGIASGVLWNLKLTGPLYSAPIVALLLERSGWRHALVAVFVSAAVMAAPFLIWANVSWASYLTWFRLSAGSGLQGRALLTNLEWAVFLGLGMTALARSPRPDASRRPPSRHLPMVGLVVGMAAVAIAASKPGAGAYHLLPFIPILCCLSLDGGHISTPPHRHIAGGRSGARRTWRSRTTLALLLTMLTLAGAQQAQWIRAMLSRRHVDDASDIQEFVRTHPGRTEMGYGTNEPLTLGRPWLVFHNNGYLIDQPAVREHQLAGLTLPAATIAAVRACDVRYWLIPAGETPFAARNVYPSTGFAPLYPEAFTQAFFETYERVSATTYFDVWQCRRAVVR